MSKYDPLYTYLSQRKENSVTLLFDDMEKIIGDKLPVSAYKYAAWWNNHSEKTHPHSKSWLDAGYETVDISENLGKQIMRFERK